MLFSKTVSLFSLASEYLSMSKEISFCCFGLGIVCCPNNSTIPVKFNRRSKKIFFIIVNDIFENCLIADKNIRQRKQIVDLVVRRHRSIEVRYSLLFFFFFRTCNAIHFNPIAIRVLKKDLFNTISPNIDLLRISRPVRIRNFHRVQCLNKII